jgi:hypothetical protein
MEVTVAVPQRLRRGLLRRRRITGQASGVGAGRSRPAGEVEPFSFVSAALLGHLARALGLSPGETLVDLGCGRGGPGLWLADAVDRVVVTAARPALGPGG